MYRTRTLDSEVVVRELLLVTFFAALTALSAQVTIRLPISPVPVTLQVLMVLLSGLALGSRRGFASQMAYLSAGAAGLPVFAHGTGGPAVFWGPTAGYLVSFPVAAFAAGWLRERLSFAGLGSSLAASVAGLTIIYSGGALWLAAWLRATGTSSMLAALLEAWRLGIAPFMFLDLAKALLAALSVQGSRALLATWLGAAGPGSHKGRM